MSQHYSPFHRGPEDHDPPPPYVPPVHSTAPSSDVWQNQANEQRENRRVTSEMAPQPYAAELRNSQTTRRNSTTYVTSRQNAITSSTYVNPNQTSMSRGALHQNSMTQEMVPPEPPAGPLYCAPPPAGPFYPCNGNSHIPQAAPEAPRLCPTLQQQTSSNLQNQRQRPSGPLYRLSVPPGGQLYNRDTEGVSSYGATVGTIMFNAMPSQVESSSEISSGFGRRCCNIL